MLKKSILSVLAVVTLFVLIGALVVNSNSESATIQPCCEGGVVDKTPCESFAVEITFKNTGKTTGTWSVNIAFEGDSWTWSGTPCTLTLKPCNSRTLKWNGTVPSNAPTNSMARLIVYYNDSYTPLDWWIHVIPSAELTITSSTVR